MSAWNFVCALKKDSEDARDFVYLPPKLQADLPASADLAMPPPLNQGNLGSCTANAVSNYVKRLLEAKPWRSEYQPSRLYQYYNSRVLIEGESPGADSGSSLRDACKALRLYDSCDEKVWPYDTTKFAAGPPLSAYRGTSIGSKLKYHSVAKGHLRAALASGTPVLAGLVLYDSVKSALTTGDIPMPGHNDKVLGGHAVVITGYDDAAGKYTFQSSWGSDVGKGGFFTIPYAYVESYASDLWVIGF